MFGPQVLSDGSLASQDKPLVTVVGTGYFFAVPFVARSVYLAHIVRHL